MHEPNEEEIPLLLELKELEELCKRYDEFLGEDTSNPNNEIGEVFCEFTERPRKEIPDVINDMMARCIFRAFRVMEKIAAIDHKCALN